MATHMGPSTTSTSLASNQQDKEILATRPDDVEKSAAVPDTPPATQHLPARPYGGIRWFLVCISIYSTALLYGLDNTIAANLQAAIVETYGEVEKLGWVGYGFPLGAIGALLTFGKAYGIFDVKWLYCGSLFIFAVGSALCGAAPTMNALIVGRVIAGIGSSGAYIGVLNLITINTSDHERPMYMGLTGLIWGTGCILGPVIAGGFADSSATWRWAFYINLILFGIASPVYLFILGGNNPQPEKTLKEKLSHMDWLGMALNSSLYVFFVCAFSFAGAQWSWHSGGTIAFFVLFGVTLIAFIAQQGIPFGTTVQDRLYPADFLRHRSMWLLYIATSAGGAGLFIPLYYIPVFFAFTRGDNGIEAAVRLLPFICVMIFASLLNGGLMPKLGVYQPWYLAAGIFLTIGSALMYSIVDANTSNGTIYGISVLIGLGAGLSQQAAYSIAPVKIAVKSNMGPARIADAIGFINAAQIGSIVIALTITSTVFQNIGYKHVSAALEGLDFSSQEIRAALAGAKSAVFTSDKVTPEIRERIVAGIIKAIGDGYILSLTAGAVLLVSSLFMKWERLFMEIGASG